MQSSSHRKVTILAHRGTSLLAPENTLPAFEFARQHHADVLELDVRLSRDRRLLVTHDNTLERTTNGSGRVADLHTVELQALDAAYRFDAAGGFPLRGSGVQLLTIDEVFSRFPEMGINVDIKDNSTGAVDVLAQSVQRADGVERVVVASFHQSVLQYCRRTYPWLTTSACAADVRSFLWRYLRGTHSRCAMPVSLFQLPRRYFCIFFERRWFIDAVHEAGGQVHFWTVNEAEVMRQLVRVGADGIVTDRADTAAQVIVDN
jgi:glycerophosphoryl diester phosphodiesterase